MFPGKTFGSLSFNKSCILLVDSSFGENFYNKQLENKEHYCGRMVLYV